jgi:hypothetical protein
MTSEINKIDTLLHKTSIIHKVLSRARYKKEVSMTEQGLDV